MSVSKYRVLVVLAACAAACSSGPNEEDRQTSVIRAALVDTSVCPAGSHIIVGTPGDDELTGTDGADCILGDAGNDVIRGLDGNDVLVGGEGADLLDGGDGQDTLEGGEGDDQLDGGNGEDILAGGPDNDLLVGGTGKDSADGAQGNDVLIGGEGKDTLSGGDGDDVIDGSNGQDDSSGGAGSDSCDETDCENGETAVATCSSDANCASGLRCASVGICVACLANSECDDGNPCTSESCTPTVGCENPVLSDGAPCLDSTLCNGTETCLGGVCTPGTPLVCDDGQFCNGAESCDALLGCRSGLPPALTDFVFCTVDTCNEETDSVEHTPSDARCDNGLFCDGAETCELTGCRPGARPVTDDGIGCTIDSCDEVTDTIVNFPLDSLCGPGRVCGSAGCQSDCAPMTLYSGVERCVTVRPETVEFRLSATDPQPWTQQYVEADEPGANFCGPTAGKNFLYWYDQDVDYATLAGEMNTNTWDFGLVAGLVVLAGPAVGCFELISCAIVTGLVSGLLVDAGTLSGDLRNALNARAPAGTLPA